MSKTIEAQMLQDLRDAAEAEDLRHHDAYYGTAMDVDFDAWVEAMENDFGTSDFGADEPVEDVEF